jgi:hypothetical protein
MFMASDFLSEEIDNVNLALESDSLGTLLKFI